MAKLKLNFSVNWAYPSVIWASTAFLALSTISQVTLATTALNGKTEKVMSLPAEATMASAFVAALK